MRVTAWTPYTLTVVRLLTLCPIDITKIEDAGVKGEVLTWITNCLVNREQKVVINSSHSTWVKVRSGVPQGSVL